MKRALITGIGGQDASFLAEFLLEKGYKVFGTYRDCDNLENIRTFEHKLTLLKAELGDYQSLVYAVQEANPDEVYNLASLSHVGFSWGEPVLVGDITGLGVARLLNAIKKYNPRIKFYQASSSEMFGNSFSKKGELLVQNENTPFHPRSPYAVAKVYAYYITVNYRESFDMFCCNGILMNHESERRGLQFVTRKITTAVARIKAGIDKYVYLGNLDSKRDWGYAKDYVEAMWLMLQQDKPDDYVIASGESHSIKEFLDEAFKCIGINDWGPYVKIDKRFVRPAEVHQLVGDPSKAKETFGWKPKTTFKELVKLMVDSDVKRFVK